MNLAEFEQKIVELLPKLLDEKPEFKIELYRILSKSYVIRDELQAYMKKNDERFKEMLPKKKFKKAIITLDKRPELMRLCKKRGIMLG